MNSKAEKSQSLFQMHFPRLPTLPLDCKITIVNDINYVKKCLQHSSKLSVSPFVDFNRVVNDVKLLNQILESKFHIDTF